MIRTLLFVLLLSFFICQRTNAQEYLLTFSGNVDSVLIENLVQGTVFSFSGYEGLFLRKTLVGNNRINLSEKQLKIYPNPSSGNTIVEFGTTISGIGHLEIFDLSGKKIYEVQKLYEQGRNSFQLSGLPNGIFLLRVYSQSFNYTGKIVSRNSDRRQIEVSSAGIEEIADPAAEKSVSTVPQMQYNQGERLKLTGFSGSHSTIITIIPEKDTLVNFTLYSCKDGDGFSYPVVEIGNQLWMAENLQTSKFEDSTPITYISQDSVWVNSSTPAFCYYGFDESNKTVFGLLYNRFSYDKEINGGKNICPNGWHVPGDAEWNTLAEFLDNESFVGGKLKETGLLHWENPNSQASNESGFTGLPGGAFLKDSSFSGLGFDSYFWTSTNSSVDSTWYRKLENDNGELGRFSCPTVCGLSIRCVNDVFYGSAVIPVLTTISADSISGVSALIGGEVISDGGATVISRGICWSSHSNLTLADSCTNEGDGPGSFSSKISGLSKNTTYYARSYAINNVGTGYGNEIIFKTLIELPKVITKNVSYIFSRKVIGGGEISDDGGDSIISRGVCWSTVKNPTISDNKTTDGSGSGSFISNIDSLMPSTNYYIRAYAINSIGVNYGNEIVIQTRRDEPILTTDQVTNITMSSATCGGNITHDGGKPITSRGICWSKTFPSIIDNDKDVDEGSGEGSFTGQLSGLSANTNYSVWAYVINEDGVFYASGYGFKTSKGPEVKMKSVTFVSNTYANITGEVISEGGNTVKERGFCWSTSPNPTIENDRIVVGQGVGEFKKYIYNLSEDTRYYVKAFATNNNGTSYSDVMQFTTRGTITDIDGNDYTTVTIGSQKWMAENLKTTNYNNGIAIPLVTDRTEWSLLKTAGYYPYSSGELGYFYNYFTIADTNNVCPVGWHVPTGPDLVELQNFLGGWEVAGGSMKSTSDLWSSPNTKATNSSGFTGLPAGLRRNIGQMEGYGESANWWTTIPPLGSNGYCFRLWFGDANCKTVPTYKTYGLSIRCVKDK